MSNTQLATQNQKAGIASYLGSDAVKNNIAGVIGEKNITRFISSVVSAVQVNPTLAQCTNSSILSAALQGEALQLAPSPQLGQFYMVPYDKKEKVNGKWQITAKEAQFQIGWKGYVQLAIRSGEYEKIVVNEIKKGEIEYNPITEDIATHPIMEPEEREKAETVGYYAMFKLHSGYKKEIFSPKAAILAHAKKYSQAYRTDLNKGYQNSKWTTDFDAMAKKTLIRQLIGKWGPMSVEMQQAYEKDMSVIDEDGSARYVDNTVDVEIQVAEDIDAHANTVDFEEAEVVDNPKPADQPKQDKPSQIEPPKQEPKQATEDDVPAFMRG